MSTHPSPGDVSPHQLDARPALERLPLAWRVAGVGAWILVGIGLAVYGVYQVLSLTTQVLIPVAVGMALAALLGPLARRLDGWLPARLPSAAVAAVLILGLVTVVFTMATLAGQQLIDGYDDLRQAVIQGLQSLEDWLRDGPFGMGGSNIAGDLIERVRSWAADNSGSILQSALAFGNSAIGFVVGTLLALVTAFFLLADGDSIWRWAVRLLPAQLQSATDAAGRAGWVSVESYARTQVVVALVDAVLIAGGAGVLGVPFVLPIGIIVFLTAFIPVVGAFLSGAVAVLVALAFQGPTIALVMIAIVVAVQQLEGNVLQPMLMGRAVNLHPWGIIVGVALFSYLYGIVGALFSVPIMAFVNTSIRVLRRELTEPRAEGPPTREEARSVTVLEDEHGAVADGSAEEAPEEGR